MITLTVIMAFLKKALSSAVAFCRRAWVILNMQKWETVVVVGCVFLVLVLAFSYCDKKKKDVEIEDTKETITIIQNEKDARIKKEFTSIDERKAADDAKVAEAQKRTPAKKNVTAKELEEKARGKK